MQNNYVPNRIDKRDSFIENWVYDENNVLNPWTKDIWYSLKSIFEWSEINPQKLYKIDLQDLDNLSSWYDKYKIISSYPEKKDRIFSEKDKNLIAEIKSKKWNLDLMNLVEISIGWLLEKSLEDSGFNVRVRKTSDFDDFKSWIDYIVEYLDENRNITNLVWIDLTISGDYHTIDRKKDRKTTKPLDYIDYLKSRKWIEIKNDIPRLVLHIDRDFAFSMTNKYFEQVLEKWDLLDSEDISGIVNSAIKDLEIKLKTSANTFWVSRDIWHLIEETKTLTRRLTRKII